MSDFTITPDQVVQQTSWLRGVAGVQINAGQAIVLDPATNQMVLADANNTALLPEGSCSGIACSTSAPGQPVFYVPSGYRVQLGTSGVGAANEPVFLSTTPGAMRPRADLTTGSTMVATFLGNLNASGRQLIVNIAIGPGRL